MGKHGLTTMERILARIVIDDTTGCWLWPGSTAEGYGTIRVEGRTLKVHRVVYEQLVGPIPPGLELDHVRERGCIHRHCCHPDHLEPVTHRVNVLRGDGMAAQRARRTHCPRGHEYNETNTYRSKHGRECRACWAVR